MTPHPGGGRVEKRRRSTDTARPSAAAAAAVSAVAVGNGFVDIPTFAQHICSDGYHHSVSKRHWRQ